MIFYSLVDFWKASTKYLSEAGRNSHQQYYSDFQTENEKYKMKNVIKNRIKCIKLYITDGMKASTSHCKSMKQKVHSCSIDWR